MNYLKLFHCQSVTNPNNHNSAPNITNYFAKFCQYKYQRTGMLHPLYANDQVRGWYIDGIKNNALDYTTTFPEFNEKIADATQFNQAVLDLEQKYTTDAINNKKTIKIIKTVTPNIFSYNGKEYDFTDYKFEVIINNDKNDSWP